ncbi:hypothetical protein DVH05_012072 [Phytophthora capsici]|nr:hypothetical protein DVH05_012072 [Phytophthora capsici]
MSRSFMARGPSYELENVDTSDSGNVGAEGRVTAAEIVSHADVRHNWSFPLSSITNRDTQRTTRHFLFFSRKFTICWTSSFTTAFNLTSLLVIRCPPSANQNTLPCTRPLL